MSKTCVECGARCCKYFCFEVDTPDSYEEFEDVRWYLCHEGVTVHVEDGDWYIAIENRCRKLGADDRCVAYEDRPLICRTYPTDKCDFTDGDYDYDILFRTPEAVEAYARKALGDEKFERERAKARAAARSRQTGVETKPGRTRLPAQTLSRRRPFGRYNRRWP